MDYELTLKVRNAPMLNAMRECGYETAAELSRASGVGQGDIGELLNLKKSAYCADGVTPRPVVTRLAQLLAVSFNELFPPKHLSDPIANNVFTAQVKTHQLEQLSNMATEDPSRLLEIMETEQRDTFSDMISNKGLTGREERVLKYRMVDGCTLDQTALNMGLVTRERVRQIEAGALRKLRHPSRSGKVVEAAGVYGEGYVRTDT